MSEVGWVDELLQGWRYRMEERDMSERLIDGAMEYPRYEAPLTEPMRQGFLGRWRDSLVRRMEARFSGGPVVARDGVPDAVLMGQAKRGVMVAGGWVDEVHEMPHVVYPRRSGKASAFDDVPVTWGGFPIRVMRDDAIGRAVALEEAIAHVTATFAAQGEEVMTHAVAAVLRTKGWTVAEPGHVHVWEMRTPRDMMRNQWVCSCGDRKNDERMPG